MRPVILDITISRIEQRPSARGRTATLARLFLGLNIINGLLSDIPASLGHCVFARFLWLSAWSALRLPDCKFGQSAFEMTLKHLPPNLLLSK
jgi:hypothetical protein